MTAIGPNTIHGPGWQLAVPVLACTVCGSADLIAIAPGTENERAADLFVVEQGEPSRAWCAAHWPFRVCVAAVSA